VPLQDWDDVREVVQRLVDSSSDLRITQGKKVFEIRPNVAWNKGKALLFLMEVSSLSTEHAPGKQRNKHTNTSLIGGPSARGSMKCPLNVGQ
jgi:trehalose-6-phosphatase